MLPGNSSFLRGRGGLATPFMGISRARLNVAQFGAMCLSLASSNSWLRRFLSLNTSFPLKRSQGSRIVKLQLNSEVLWNFTWSSKLVDVETHPFGGLSGETGGSWGKRPLPALPVSSVFAAGGLHGRLVSYLLDSSGFLPPAWGFAAALARRAFSLCFLRKSSGMWQRGSCFLPHIRHLTSFLGRRLFRDWLAACWPSPWPHFCQHPSL